MTWIILALVARLTAAQASSIPDVCVGSSDIIAANQTVTYTGTVTVGCLGIHGTLLLSDGTTLTATTIHVYTDGRFDTVSHPATNVTIQFADSPIDTTLDPEQFGHGLLVSGNGRLTLQGQPKTTFVPLAAAVAVGATSLTLLSDPIGWQAGDRLVLPDTRQWSPYPWQNYSTFVGQWETPTVASVSGAIVTLTVPLQYAHQPAKTEAGAPVFYAHVGNLSRSVTLRSMNPAGVRAHALFTDRADVRLSYAAFVDMGRTTNAPLDCTRRQNGSSQTASKCTVGTGAVTHIGTNHIGRYPVHFHMLMGPMGLPSGTPQFEAIGLSVVGTPKWALAVHHSSYGLVRDTVMYDFKGAGLVAEDGSETENVIDHNFAVRGTGTGGRQGEAREGVGFYFFGPLNRVTNNVAANLYSDGPDAAFGFKVYLTYLGNITIPTTPDGSSMTTVDGNAQALREFRGNEVWSSDSGLTYWWIGTFGANAPRLSTPESVIDALHVFHSNGAIFHYESYRVTIRDLVAHNDPARRSQCCTGIFMADYYAHTIRIENPTISYFGTGIAPSASAPTPLAIVGGMLTNTVNVGLSTLYTSSYRADGILPRLVTIDGTRFATPTNADASWVGGVKAWLAYFYSASPVRNLTQRDEVTVTNWNGVVGDNFQYYFSQQAPSFVVPVTIRNGDGSPSLVGASVPGHTNQQVWADEGKAIGGAVAPCLVTRPNVSGYACASGSPPPDTTPPAIALAGCSASQVFTATVAASDNVGVVNVTFQIDGQPYATLTTAPYTITVPSAGYMQGAHTVVATAHDAAGNASSQSFTFTVNAGCF